MIVEDPEHREVDALVALLPPQQVILEVGCGEGRLTLRYADRAYSVLAIDPDETRIAAFRARRPPPNVEVRGVGIDRLALDDGSVDVVILAWSL